MIFEFKSYRPFLKAYMRTLPKNGFGEAKRMAEELGVSSTYISHILSGKKELSTEQVLAMSDYLGLSDLESDYFYYLVQIERAGTARLKKFCDRKLQEIKSRSLKLNDRLEFKKTLSDEEKAIFYSNALYSCIHLFTSIHETGTTINDIESRFEIPRAKALEMIRFLLDAGIVVEKGGRYLMGIQSTHLEDKSPHLLKHHANWRIRAIQASENLDESELMMTGNFSLSKKDFQILREDIVQTIKRYMSKIHASPAEEIACLNIDWFWIRK